MIPRQCLRIAILRAYSRQGARIILPCRNARSSAGPLYARRAKVEAKEEEPQEAKKKEVLESWAAQNRSQHAPKLEEEEDKEEVPVKRVGTSLGLLGKAEQTIAFPSLGVSEPVARALSQVFNATIPSAAQRALLPAVLSHSNVILKDETGSGKTLGLVAAILSKSHPPLVSPANSKAKSKDASTRTSHTQPAESKPVLHTQRYLTTLVIVPTRELAVQITTWIRDLSPHVSPSDHTKLVQCAIHGVDEEVQFDLLRSCTPRILVGTPVRLLSLYERRAFDASRLQVLVMDEVDRLVEPRARYDPVNVRFNKKVHPLAGETLLDKIIKDRNAARTKELNRDKGKKGMVVKDSPKMKRMQVIACSATLNNPLRRDLTLIRGWMTFPTLLDMKGTSKAPHTITHRCLVLDPNGELREMEDVEQSERPKTGQVAPLDEGGDPALPDDADEVIETISRICYEEKVKSGLVFAHSSVSMTGLVAKLNAIGLRADRLLNAIDYEGSTVGTANSGDVATKNEEADAPTAEVTSSNPSPDTTSTTQNSSLTSEQNQARRPFASFLAGKTTLLVLTEYEARGLDLPNATHVFILGPPSSPASYLHMAGRAGRYGKPGHAMTLLGGQRYENRVQNMFRLLRIRLNQRR